MRLVVVALLVWVSICAYAQPSVSASKVALANQVLQRIGAAYGFGVLELPKLILFARKEGNRRTAKLELALVSANKLDRSRLLMDEELLDVCTSIDEQTHQPGAALAFVLSHEMAHFYLKHATFRNFADQGKETIRTESYRQEKEADQTGLLFAYLAGYDPESGMDQLFDRIYGQYKLKDVLPGYPTKAERKQTTKLRVQAFRAYGYLFAVGHALYCRENFAEAARCFEYVYSRYPLKEAYNNFGVCRLQEAIRLQKKTPVSYFALPFEIDPRNRLLRLDERSGNDNAATSGALLTEAKAAFRQAMQMDDRFQAAYLNAALAELLSGNPHAALGVLSDQKKQLKQSPNSLLVQGIVQYVLGDLTKAETDLKAAGRKAYQADYNLYVFRSLKKGASQSLHQPWQQIKKQSTTDQSLGCQAQGQLLTEIDNVPGKVKFTTYLIEQSNPPPFIVVESGQAASDTYFRVKLNSVPTKLQPSSLYYVQKK